MSNEQVFISYAEPDSEFAHRLADDLEAHGMGVWIAPESVRPGETWVDAIDRGLSESDYLVITLTPAAMESDWVRKETSVGIMLERKGQLTLIPLDVKPADVGPLLSSYQMVSFREEYDAGFERLSRELGIANGEPAASRPRQKAPLTPHTAPDSVELETLKEVISTYSGVDATDIHANTDLVHDLTMDELDLVELLMELEAEYDISIPDEDVFTNSASPSTSGWKLPTVGDVAAYVEARVEGADTQPAASTAVSPPPTELGGGERRAYEERSFYSQPLWWVSLVAFPLISAVAAILTHILLSNVLTNVGLFLPRTDATFLVLTAAGIIWGVLYAADGAINAQEPSDYLLVVLGPYDDLLAGVDAEDRIRGLLTAMPVNILVSWGLTNVIAFALLRLWGGIGPTTIYVPFALLTLEGIRRYIAYVV